MSKEKKLYHLVSEELWAPCRGPDGALYFPATYDQDGFTHMSDDTDLLLEIGNHFYKSHPGHWLLLVCDLTKLEGEVKWEPAAPVGDVKAGFGGSDGKLFPHLYGPIAARGVDVELKVERAPDGTFLSIPLS